MTKSENKKKQTKQLIDAAREKFATEVKEANEPKPAKHKKLSPEKRLHSQITRLLGGPGGDPDMWHMLGAAHAVVLLEELGTPYLPRSKDDDTLDFLAGKNSHNTNFLEYARRDATF